MPSGPQPSCITQSDSLAETNPGRQVYAHWVCHLSSRIAPLELNSPVLSGARNATFSTHPAGRWQHHTSLRWLIPLWMRCGWFIVAPSNFPPPSWTCNGPDGSQGTPSSSVHHHAPAAPHEAKHMCRLSSRTAPLEFVATQWSLCSGGRGMDRTADGVHLSAHTSTMHHAPCTMHHAPRTTHHAPCTIPHPLLVGLLLL